MARVTVEDCIDKVDSPYELVLVAKERATQLNAGIEPTIDRDNDKNTVISLREIAEEKIQVSDLTDSAVYKLRKHVEQVDDTTEDDEDIGDDFENLYKGEISKSGTPILPSKRARKTPEKIQVTKDDLAELSETAKVDVLDEFDRTLYVDRHHASHFHVWPKVNPSTGFIHQYGGLKLIPAEAVKHLKPNTDKIRKMSFKNKKPIKSESVRTQDIPYDVVMLSYREPEADANYAKLLEKVPNAKRVHGVKGIFNTPQRASEIAESSSLTP